MSNGQPAPGWYPDHNDPAIVRYWNGQQWTEHTAEARPAHPVQPQPAQHRPPGVSSAGAGGSSWFSRNKAATIAIGVVSAFVLIGIIGAAVGSTDKADHPKDVAAVSDPTPSASSPTDGKASAQARDESSSPQESTPSQAESETAGSDPAPSVQDQFIAIVEKGHDVAESGNEIAVVQARKARGKAACSLLGPSLAVKDWDGTVESVETELGGDDGVLAIDITDDIAIQTWNNSVSDIGSGTLINPNSKVYGQLAQLQEGDDVVFGGQFVRDGSNCLEEQSLIDVNGMLTPDFSFKFTSVKAR